jgi:hypothetical protein
MIIFTKMQNNVSFCLSRVTKRVYCAVGQNKMRSNRSIGLWVALFLFLFCEALAFSRPTSALMLLVALSPRHFH